VAQPANLPPLSPLQALPASSRRRRLCRPGRAGRCAVYGSRAEAAAPAQLDDEGQAPVGCAVVTDRIGEHAALQQGCELRTRGRDSERSAPRVCQADRPAQRCHAGSIEARRPASATTGREGAHVQRGRRR